MSKKPINELSKKTLGRYIQGAVRDSQTKTERESERHTKMRGVINNLAQGENDSYETGKHAKDNPEARMRSARHDLDAADRAMVAKHSDKMYNRQFGVRTALAKLGASKHTPKVMAREENEMDENEDTQEIEVTPAQAIIAAALNKDHVGMADAFNAAVRAKIDSALFGGDDEQDDDATPAGDEDGEQE